MDIDLAALGSAVYQVLNLVFLKMGLFLCLQRACFYGGF